MTQPWPYRLSHSGSNLADGPGFDVGIVHGGHGGDGDKRQGRSYGELVVPTEEGRVRVSSARFRQVKGAGHLQQQMRWGGAAATGTCRSPFRLGLGSFLRFTRALVTTGMSERSENGRGGQVRAARQKGGGATNFDLNTGRYGQFFQ